MTTAVRIKRKAGEVAPDAIVIAPKIARTAIADEATSGAEPAEPEYTFHYVGSFMDPDSTEATETILRAKEAKRLKRDPKLRPVDLQSKLREEQRSAAKKKRTETISKRRAIIKEVLTEEVDDDTKSLFRLYDVVAEDSEGPQPAKESGVAKKEEKNEEKIEVTCNNVAMIRETVKGPEGAEAQGADDYVYDIYYSPSQYHLPPDDLCRPDDLYKVVMSWNWEQASNLGQPCLLDQAEAEVFGVEEPDDDSDCGLEVRDDESDSNDEDNWRNDYPDEVSEGQGRSRYRDLYSDFYEDEDMAYVSGQFNIMDLESGAVPQEED